MVHLRISVPLVILSLINVVINGQDIIRTPTTATLMAPTTTIISGEVRSRVMNSLNHLANELNRRRDNSDEPRGRQTASGRSYYNRYDDKYPYPSKYQYNSKYKRPSGYVNPYADAFRRYGYQYSNYLYNDNQNSNDLHSYNYLQSDYNSYPPSSSQYNYPNYSSNYKPKYNYPAATSPSNNNYPVYAYSSGGYGSAGSYGYTLEYRYPYNSHPYDSYDNYRR